MHKLYFISAFLLLVSCTGMVPEQEPGRRVTLAVNLPQTKVNLPGDRSAFAWQAGDQVNVFNDVNASSAAFEVLGGETQVEVPALSTTLYGLYPHVSTSAGPSAAPVSVPAAQTQTAGGVFPSHNYPMAASGAISNGGATLSFKPLVSALALNIYGGTGSITAVRVTPLANAGFVGSASLNLTDPDVAFTSGTGGATSVTVTLGTPVPVGTKPATDEAKRTFPGQIYVCLARQVYTRLQIEVSNGNTIYKLTTSNTFEFDCTAKDIILTGINLDKGTVEVSGVSGEVFDASGAFEKMAGDFDSLYYLPDDLDNVDRIPDFSRVGYKYGDEPIPTRTVRRTVSISDVSAAIAGGTASDTTDFLQQALDAVGAAGGGALVLNNGTWNVSRILFIDQNNVVLRGQSRAGTIIKSNTHNQMPIVYVGASVAQQGGDVESETLTFIAGRRVGISSLTAMGNTGQSSYGSVIIKTYTPKFPSKTYGSLSPIADTYLPLGSLSVEVLNPNLFSAGDKVCIYRPATEEWIEDIGMDRIASNGRDPGGVVQWDETLSSFNMRWTRVVTAVRGNRVYLDAPVAQAIDRRYGGGHLEKYSQTRVTGCGVENISFDCSYDNTVIYNEKEVDECHAWQAVLVRAAEHCWIRNVTSRHMGYALADLGNSARCITVEGCSSLSPISAVQGARRYAYCLSPGSELCLVKNSSCDDDRHSFVTNGTSLGPNVFTGCTSTNGHAAIGPHYWWASCVLWDCIEADSNFEAQDGGNQGTGHGWRGMNCVFWNISTTAQVVCQSAWGTCLDCGAKYQRTSVCSVCSGEVLPSGRNYTVGAVGTKVGRTINWNVESGGAHNVTEDYFVTLYGYGSNGENRPDGEWYPARAYDSSGGSPVSLPATGSLPTWWPILTQENYSTPNSLYECQLEDRHARGIYLNTL